MNTELERDIKLDIIEGKYKCISAYKIPDKPEDWLRCPNCNLKPLVWAFNNGVSTACGCGKNEYDHFSINYESVMSYGKRNNFDFTGYDSNGLRDNWNNWVLRGIDSMPRDKLLEMGRW